jgi:ABC-type antimicrobial peptide transport system permease subunit
MTRIDGSLWQDLRYGGRMLVKSPAFTTVAVLSLALGIGGNTAIFSVADKVLFRKLPVEDADRLVVVTADRGQGVTTLFNYPDFADYRDRNDVFDGLVCFTQRPVTLSDGAQAERILAMIVSGNYFTALGVRPELGRGFLKEEDTTPETHPVVVVSDGLWRRRFAADPALVGKTVSLNGRRFTVVGIAPPHFAGTVAGSAPDVYVPIMMMGQASPASSIGIGSLIVGPRSRTLSGWLQVMGRLKPGVSREQAAAAMTTLGGQIAQAHRNLDGTPRVEPKILLADGSRGEIGLLRDLRLPLQMLMATVGLILLIACANVANLLLARGATRRKEIAIRLATGAGRLRLVRQLLTESLLLSALGGAAGLALAVSLVTAIVFGLAPALAASRLDLVPALKDETAVFGQNMRYLTPRNLLVTGQVALAVLVLIGAGLCLRSLRNLQEIDAGFDLSNVLVMSVDVALSGYDRERGARFYAELLERIKRLPRVEAASLATQIPLGDGFGAVIRSEGYVPRPGEDLSSDFNQIAPDYFRTMSIPVLDGREFDESDTTTTRPVAIINETAARRFWPGQSPVGLRLITGRPPDEQVREIIGVVRDSKHRRLTEDARPAVYIPFLQRYRGDMTLHVHFSGDADIVAAAVRSEVRALDATLPLYNVKTLEEQKTSSLYVSRMAATLLTMFGLLAVVLAAVGLYGVMAYSVNRRTREIGIRLALGAQGHQVRRLVMAEGTIMIAVGVVTGLAAALAATRLVEGFLYGVAPTDPIAFAGAPLLLAIVAASANYVPARHASRTDPMRALRH